MLQALDAAQVRRWAVACVQALDAHREAIDGINVYPVPDGDTGSNLLHTMRAALDALLRAPAKTRSDAGAAVAALARGALTGARGNSGVIVSQFLRGLADALTEAHTGSPAGAELGIGVGSGSGVVEGGGSVPGGDSGSAGRGGAASGGGSGAGRGAGGGPDASTGSGGDPGSGGDSGFGGPASGGGVAAGSGSGSGRDGGASAAAGGDSGSGRDAAFGGGVAEGGGSGSGREVGAGASAALGADAGSGAVINEGAAAGDDSGRDADSGASAVRGVASAEGTAADSGPGSGGDAAVGDGAAAGSGSASGPGASAAAGRDAAPGDGAALVAGSGAGATGVVLGPGLRAALARGAERATAAMAEPVAGTMITVFEAAAAAAWEESSDALQDVAAAAATAAAAALDETPRQLPVLADAGVVDAGGRGVVVLFDALLAVVAGQPAALAAAQRVTAERAGRAGVAARESSLYTSRESGSDAFAYEVMYLLDQVGGDPDADRLRDVLVSVGDSVSVAGDGDGLWSVHVHCNDIGAAIEAGIDIGRPRQIRVARFADAPSAESSRFTKDRAVVVPSRSAEFADLLISEGVVVCRVDERGPDGDPGTAQRLLEAITGTGAAHVTVLPADPALVDAADEAAIRAVAAGQDVVVVPGASPVQVLAAVAVHDPRRRASDDVVAMAEAAAATRRGRVVVATEAAITWIGACEAGDVLGFADGEVVLIEPGPPDIAALDRAARGVVSRMLTMGGELITALLGADAPDELATELEDHLRRSHPETELVVYQGGQHNAVLLLGVE